MTQPPPDDPPADQTGTVGEELAKLLGALSELAGSKPASDAAATPLSAVQDLSDRWLADGHGGPDCRYCPICRAIHLVRECSPEVRTHLAVAAMSLLQAGAAVLSTQIPRDPDPHPRDGVQPIDVEDGMPWPDTATDHDGAVSSDNDEE